MIARLKESIIDRYLTWRTGKNKQRREYEAWYYETVIIRSSTVQDRFKNFEYIIHVDAWKIFDMHDPFGMPLVEDACKYFWPQREPGNCAVYYHARGSTSKYDNEFYITDLGGEDRVYVATDNERDAVMIALRYA